MGLSAMTALAPAWRVALSITVALRVVAAVSTEDSANSTARANSKRGISYHATTDPADYDILLSGSESPINWYYTWSPNPAPEDTMFAHEGSYEDDIEFVPTFHGLGNLEEDLAALRDLPALPSGSRRHLFTFNEPDEFAVNGGSQLSPAEAAEAYIHYALPLRDEGPGYFISHPSVTGSPRGLDWLAQFHQECWRVDPENGCPTDFLVVHWYGDFNGLASWMGQIRAWYLEQGVYGTEEDDDNLGMWIAELGIPGANEEANRVLMEQAMSYLDGLDYAIKYSWFGTFRPQEANWWTGEGVCLFDEAGGLTSLGSIYMGGEANGYAVGDQGRPPPPPEEGDGDGDDDDGDGANNDDSDDDDDDDEDEDGENSAKRNGWPGGLSILIPMTVTLLSHLG